MSKLSHILIPKPNPDTNLNPHLKPKQKVSTNLLKYFS